MRELYSICSNKENEYSFTSILFSSSFSAHDYSKEQKMLNIELELLRNINWDFDYNIINPIFSILSESKEKKSVSQRKTFDCNYIK